MIGYSAIAQAVRSLIVRSEQRRGTVQDVQPAAAPGWGWVVIDGMPMAYPINTRQPRTWGVGDTVLYRPAQRRRFDGESNMLCAMDIEKETTK